MIRRLLLKWFWRDTSRSELEQIHELVVLAARRCAYDLKHAGSQIQIECKDDFINYCERADHWLAIFNAGSQGKHYRHELHLELNNALYLIERYRSFLKKEGIKDPYPDDPF